MNQLKKKGKPEATYSFLYESGLLSTNSQGGDRLFVSTNFLRGVQYFKPRHFTHRRDWVFRGFEHRVPDWYSHNILFFYNPLLLLMHLKCLSLFLMELAVNYGNVLYLSTYQYHLPMHYMMRWYSRGSKQSCIGTVWQYGTFSSMYTRYVVVRRCLLLPFKAVTQSVPMWRFTFAQILFLIKILRNFFFHYEYYGRIRKEINRLRKIFKMFYYYRFIENPVGLDAIVLFEPIYRRSFKLIKEARNSRLPVIGSCSVSNTVLYYDYWLPIDCYKPASNLFVTSFTANCVAVGCKLRGLSLFLKNANYSYRFC